MLDPPEEFTWQRKRDRDRESDGEIEKSVYTVEKSVYIAMYSIDTVCWMPMEMFVQAH